MVKKASYSAILNAAGLQRPSVPNEDYQTSAHIVWHIMRDAVDDENSQPVYREGRVGYEVTGVGVVHAIRIVWPGLTDKVMNSAATRIKAILTSHDATALVAPGRGRNVQPVWWVADTYEAPEEATQAPGSGGDVEALPDSGDVEIGEMPTDWGRTTNGKKVPTLALTEQSVPGDSLDDRLEKAFGIIREVMADRQEQNTNLLAENAVLKSKIETIERAVRGAFTD
jgi:hypothetical protein